MGPPPAPSEIWGFIRGCETLLELKSVHAAILRRSHGHGPHLAADLISHYSLLGSISLAHSTFSSTSPPHPTAFNALIRAYTDHGSPLLALDLYRRMRLPRDSHTLPVVIKACSALRDFHLGASVHREALNLGFASRPAVVNALIAFYGKCGRLDRARQLFDQMPHRSPVSWSALVGAYANNGLREEALGTFSRMLAEGVPTNRGAFMSLTGCISDVESADKLCRLIEENGLDRDDLVQSAVVNMYSKCGAIGHARKLFDEMPERSLVAWNSMMEVYAETGSPLEALRLFKEMMALEVLPDHKTVRVVVVACCKLASRSSARSIHAYVLNNFVGGDEVPWLDNALVGLYAKCGMLGAARRLFDQIMEKDVASWNVMISGYGMHGRGKDALLLFEEMKASSLQPDHETFSSVLSSCCLAGLVDEGRQLFDSMKDFNIDPKHQHYAYTVELLGRAGKLDEAQEIIKNMPAEPDSSVWGALLSACREHNDLKLAESSARSLLELDPRSARSCILLSNICRCSGREKEAEVIEALMEERAIKKAVGFSFVEANHVVYEFTTGDHSNPRSEEIYKEVERLLESIREHGYEPNRNLVLHDVEDETNVESLHEHSEKLAIAFGLLNSGSNGEILVSKNSSICADCHTFAKLVSKVEGRVIVLRDAHRFYHFIDGPSS